MLSQSLMSFVVDERTRGQRVVSLENKVGLFKLGS